MKYSVIVGGRQTRIFDTNKFRRIEDWYELLGALGKEYHEVSAKISKAKYQRAANGKKMDSKDWMALNKRRRELAGQWQNVADDMVLMYPKENALLANQFMRIVRGRNEDLWKECYKIAQNNMTQIYDERPGGTTHV